MSQELRQQLVKLLDKTEHPISDVLVEYVQNEINEDTLNQLIQETKKKREEYRIFFNDTLKQYGVESPDELSDEKKAEFFDYIDNNWNAEDE